MPLRNFSSIISVRKNGGGLFRVQQLLSAIMEFYCQVHRFKYSEANKVELSTNGYLVQPKALVVISIVYLNRNFSNRKLIACGKLLPMLFGV